MNERSYQLALIVNMAVLLFCASGTAGSVNMNPWAAITSPTIGMPESIGSPTAGCLKGGTRLQDSGKGYLLMRPNRGRAFAHPRTVQLLKHMGLELLSKTGAPVLIGDLGFPRGGPTMSAHSSHQNGLDADIWYASPKGLAKNLSVRSREKLSATGMVDLNRFAVNRHFGKKQVALLRAFAESESVDRVLVHFAIKRELCRTHANEGWIQKLRPWFGHDHHFHVRVKCASTDSNCKNGEPIPTGNGCDGTLDWWWSDEARSADAKNANKQEHPVMPLLPAACAALISP